MGWKIRRYVYYPLTLLLGFNIYIYKSYIHTVDPHYPQILCLQIPLFPKICLNQYLLSSHGHSRACVEQKSSSMPAPSWGNTKWFCLLASIWVLRTSVYFMVYLVSLFYSFLHFCDFCWWLCCLEWPSNLVLKCCLMFPVWEGLLEKMLISGIINAYIKHHSGMSYSDTGHDFKVNKGTKYIKLDVLNRTSQKTRYALISWCKYCD